MSVFLQMFDEGDGCTYSLHFSNEDAEKILDANEDVLINLPSIGGNIVLKGDQAAILYKNGAGHGSVYSNYAKLCTKINESK